MTGSARYGIAMYGADDIGRKSDGFLRVVRGCRTKMRRCSDAIIILDDGTEARIFDGEPPEYGSGVNESFDTAQREQTRYSNVAFDGGRYGSPMGDRFDDDR